MSSATTFPKFLDLPFTALRILIRQAGLDDLGKLMFDKQLAEYIYSEKVWAGAYNVSFTGTPGVKVPAKDLNWSFDGPTAATVQTVLGVYENLSYRFPGYLGTISIDPFYLSSPDFPDFDSCKRLELVAQTGSLEDQPRIDALLESICISDSFKFEVLGCHLNLEKILHLDDIEIVHGTRWMLPQDLLKFDSRRLFIRYHDFEDIHVNECIRQWINAVDPKMEMMTLGAYKNWETDFILSSCNAKKFDSDRRDAVFFPEGSDVGIDMSAAMDIEREDGKLASVLITDDKLIMVVWKERFATKKDQMKRHLESDGPNGKRFRS